MFPFDDVIMGLIKMTLSERIDPPQCMNPLRRVNIPPDPYYHIRLDRKKHKKYVACKSQDNAKMIYTHEPAIAYDTNGLRFALFSIHDDTISVLYCGIM